MNGAGAALCPPPVSSRPAAVEGLNDVLRDVLELARALELPVSLLELTGSDAALERELFAAAREVGLDPVLTAPVGDEPRGLRVWIADRGGRVAVLARIDPPEVHLLPEGPAVDELFRDDARQVPGWPACLAPEQVRVLPALPAHGAVARAAAERLRAAGLRVGPVEEDGPLAQRVGAATAARVPWVVVAAGSPEAPELTLRTRGSGALEQLGIDPLCRRLRAQALENITRGGSRGLLARIPGREAAEVAAPRGSQVNGPGSAAPADSGEE